MTPETLPDAIPERVVVFGISALPQQTLEALEALSNAAQIVLCVLNPCQHFWGDIIEGKELLRYEYKRQSRRPGAPDVIDPDELHLNAHPLLAAWGKQGRDYLHLLDEHDEMSQYQGLFQHHGLRIDAFSEGRTDTLLGQLQNDILNLRPAHESLEAWKPVDTEADTSIQFSIAHSSHREVEVLHNQLLDAFASDPDLKPRDVIIMVPDSATFAPFFHAVFGQYGHKDRRHIPYRISDQRQRHINPMLVALETLLQLPVLRLSTSEVLDLIDVPALRERFDLEEGDIPTLKSWIEGANVRWGLDGKQRSSLGLPEHGEQNSWRFGLDRMMAGFALGESSSDMEDWCGIAPYTEVGGLDAALVGNLSHLIERLDYYWHMLQEARSASEWAPVLRELLDDFFASSGKDAVRLQLALESGLDDWLTECEGAEFDSPLGLNVVQETWLSRVDEQNLGQSFMGGAVTIATLMPMRAIPFKHVYLLGMNDGDYPRQQIRMDYDLMGMPGQYRPGDRSRREDDRYLLLEALLSARDRLSISWVGRSVRDNSERSCSVLVGQLQDHIGSAWTLKGSDRDGALLASLTAEHPLQPFSKEYFTDTTAKGEPEEVRIAKQRLFTYAKEWEHLHDNERLGGGLEVTADNTALPAWEPEGAITLRQLAAFMRRPVDQLYRQRLRVYFHDQKVESHDTEPFSYNHLEAWKLQDAIIQQAGMKLVSEPDMDAQAVLDREVVALLRSGNLPIEPFSGPVLATITTPLLSQLERYQEALDRAPVPITPMPEVTINHDGVLMRDTIAGIRASNDGKWVRVVLETSKVHEGKQIKWTSLVKHWPTHLALQLVAPGTKSIIVGNTGDVTLPGINEPDARATLLGIISEWVRGMHQPLPVTCKAAFAALDGGVWDEDGKGDWAGVQTAYEQERENSLPLQRHYSTFDLLMSGSGAKFREVVQELYMPMHRELTRTRQERN